MYEPRKSFGTISYEYGNQVPDRTDSICRSYNMLWGYRDCTRMELNPETDQYEIHGSIIGTDYERFRQGLDRKAAHWSSFSEFMRTCLGVSYIDLCQVLCPVPYVCIEPGSEIQYPAQ